MMIARNDFEQSDKITKKVITSHSGDITFVIQIRFIHTKDYIKTGGTFLINFTPVSHVGFDV